MNFWDVRGNFGTKFCTCSREIQKRVSIEIIIISNYCILNICFWLDYCFCIFQVFISESYCIGLCVLGGFVLRICYSIVTWALILCCSSIVHFNHYITSIIIFRSFISICPSFFYLDRIWNSFISTRCRNSSRSGESPNSKISSLYYII